MPRNVFVFGLNAFDRAKLEGIDGAEDYRLHGLLDVEEVRDAEAYRFERLLRETRERLAGFAGRIGAIAAYRVPSSVLQPLLAREFGLRSPSLHAVVKCGHKYRSRLEQRRAIPEHIPDFCAFDPFDEAALSKIHLAFPFWIKPVQSDSGYLGFRVGNEHELHTHVQTIRENVARCAEPYARLEEHLALPPEVADADAGHCLAEEILAGKQCTVEGYAFEGASTPTG